MNLAAQSPEPAIEPKVGNLWKLLCLGACLANVVLAYAKIYRVRNSAEAAWYGAAGGAIGLSLVVLPVALLWRSNRSWRRISRIYFWCSLATFWINLGSFTR